MPHVGYLDALRGLAVLGVLAVHSAATTLQTSRITWPLFGGGAGVELFYAVSAFTLFLSMDARAKEPHETRNFYIRRFFRIAPLFYLTMALSWCRLQLLFVHGYRPTAFGYLLGVLFLFGFSPTLINTVIVGGWSIAVETTFYAILPALRLCIRSLRSALIAFILAFATLIPFAHYLARRQPENAGYFALDSFPIQLPMFLMGILVYFLARKLHASQSKPTLRRISAVLLFITVAGYLLRHAPAVRPIGADYPVDLFLVGACLLTFALHPWSILDNRAIRFIGRVSYSVYLMHFFVLEVLLRASPILMHRPDTFLGIPFGHVSSFLAFIAVATPLTLVIATLSWRFIEQPGINLGRRILKRLGGVRRPDPSKLLPGTSPADDMSNAPL